LKVAVASLHFRDAGEMVWLMLLKVSGRHSIKVTLHENDAALGLAGQRRGPALIKVAAECADAVRRSETVRDLHKVQDRGGVTGEMRKLCRMIVNTTQREGMFELRSVFQSVCPDVCCAVGIA